MQDYPKLKKMVFDLNSRVKALEISLPKWISLGDAAKDLKVSRDTLRKYLKANFEPEVDFKKIGAKLYISRDTLFLVRTHYEK
ncbi:MAG: hypothetical protein CSA86_01765 [Arcobacter sp.]|nr:MAG: hypothetical protein CSA86_01765 [Arcobacter sp.]